MRSRVQSRLPRVAFGDFGDERVRQAVENLRDQGVLEPVAVTSGPGVLAGIEQVRAPAGEDHLTILAQLVGRPDIDAGIAGSESDSSSVIRAGIKGLGTTGLVSGCFVMRWDDRMVTFADCSVVPEPNEEQLVDIAISAADLHRSVTGSEPLVGMLSFSTNGSASHRAVTKVQRATAALRARRPDLHVEGEIQFDAAIDPEVGLRKFPGSVVAGRANVLVFPSLEAGNIAYKVAERIGGARALGSFVLNLTKPWVDLSRGCSVEDLMDTARLVASMSSNSTSVKEQITS